MNAHGEVPVIHIFGAARARDLPDGIEFRASRWIIAALLSAACFGAHVAHAQTIAPASGGSSAAPAATPPDPTMLGEIIVTANKRSERLRDIPDSASVVTGASLAAGGPIVNVGTILATVPGVRFNNVTDSVLSEISIRGSGTGRATNADSAVGLFSNGVYIGGGLNFGRNFQNLDYFDLDRAEVLKGAQGALYGRNAEDGVINLISVQPKFTDSGLIDDAYTFETGQNQATAILNHPLSDEVAVRLGVQYNSQSSGFVYDPEENKYADQTIGWIGRAQIRFVHEKLDVDLLAETQQMTLPTFYSIVATPASGAGNYPNGFFEPKYTLQDNGNNLTKQAVNDVMLFVNYDFGWSTLSSTSSYRDRKTTVDYDLDLIDPATVTAQRALGNYGAYPFSQVSGDDDTSMIYEDLHLSGAALDSRLNWIGGVEYLHQKSDGFSITNANPCATGTLAKPLGQCYGTPTAPLCFQATPNVPACAVPNPLGYGTNSVSSSVYDSWALYTSLTYKIGYGVSVSGDVRYTSDDKTFHENVTDLYTTTVVTTRGASGTINAYPLDAAFKKSLTTYTATVSYAIPGSWGDLVYAKMGTGYRAGGFNPGVAPTIAPVPIIAAYNDETSKSYEVGIKGNLTHFVYFTLDAYRSTTNNALSTVSDQCTVALCGVIAANFTDNAGTEKAQGVEAQVNTSLHVVGGVLSLEMDGSTQTANYVSGPYNGTPVPQNPRFLGAVTGNYTHPLGDEVTGFVNVVYHSQRGGIQDPVNLATITATPRIALANFEDTNVRIGVDYRRFEFAVFGNNVSNETHPLLSANGNLRWSLPGVYGLEAIYKW
jgi:iron complex outermembrane recepter protein